MTWTEALLSIAAGLVISVVTTPVGVSGAVFLLPVQLSVLAVPNPAVTPTNLLFNVVSGPGALLRYRRRGSLASPLTRLLLVGTLPGVVVGAVVRVFVVPGPDVFRLIVSLLLLPLGLWLCLRPPAPEPRADPVSRRGIAGLALGVGVVGGIYGIGGGSIIGPVLVGRGMPMAVVAPAALASTFVTSVAGAAAFAVLALTGRGDIAPDWGVGILCGVGGLIGGYLGAHLQPRLPERALRLVLGGLAIALAVLYAGQAVLRAG
ncbi:sulfite exporter TauE/SafE family protein [Actinoplanes sp. NPDC049118]|uniref:sulfite exporter TauE/SafE family protein n=1 Tax=Actinoplanes sp. NPDC049118 TaxID=3155769 RepID=UPI0033E5A838